MLKAIVISNGIEGLKHYYASNNLVDYTIYEVSKTFDPPLEDFDLLVVPNGSDHIAMEKIATRVKGFLDHGGAMICCDGWFTDWIPGNRWKIDNVRKSIEIRYFVRDDPYGFFDGLDIDEFIFSHGISGYWACGYIQPAPGAGILLADTWQRPIVVLDQISTKGTIFLTASGPLADLRYDPASGISTESAMATLYHRFILHLVKAKSLQHA